MEEALGTQRYEETQGASTEGWEGGGSKRDRKETARVGGRRTEWMKPEEEEQRRGQG